MVTLGEETDWVLALENTILGDGEDDSTKDTSDTWGNDPSSEDLRHTVPAPVNTTSTESSNASSDNLLMLDLVTQKVKLLNLHHR